MTEGEVELCARDEIEASIKSQHLWDFCFSQYLRKAGASANSQPNFKDKAHLQSSGNVH